MRSTTWLFIVAAIALALPDGGLAQQPASPPASAGQKVVKDPDESKAYLAALAIADPARKAAAMEAFVARYPKSVLYVDALEQTLDAYMYTYARTGNATELLDVVNRIFQVEPGNLRALSALIWKQRPRATLAPPNVAASLRALAEIGSKALPGWKKPEGMDDATYRRLRDRMSAIFNGAAGFAALQTKDYAKAIDSYRVAVGLDPNNFIDVHQLATAELESTPTDATGFWHIARAIVLAQRYAPAAVKNITEYGKAKYRKYHGSEDGWNDIVARAATQAEPPADFAGSIKPGPTLAELALQVVRAGEPANLSFSDWEIVLGQRDASPTNKDAADKVWNAIRAKQRGDIVAQLRVKVISATRDTVLGPSPWRTRWATRRICGPP